MLWYCEWNDYVFWGVSEKDQDTMTVGRRIDFEGD